MKTEKTEQGTICYKVWIEIEAFDVSTGEGTNVDAPGAALQQFETYEQAWGYASRIMNMEMYIKLHS